MIGSGTDAECDQHLAMQTASGQGNQLEESEAPRTDPSPAQNEYSVPVTSSDSAGDILSQAANMAEIPQTREFLAWVLPPTGPADPRYFFYGAPSVEDNSPHVRLINEARVRAIQGWRQSD